MEVVDCSLQEFRLSKSSVTVNYLGPKESIFFKSDFLQKACGALNFKFTPEIDSLISFREEFPMGIDIKANSTLHIGEFTITVTASRINNPAQNVTRSFILTVLNEVTEEPPVPFVSHVSNTGMVKVTFSRKLRIPNFKMFPEFKE